MIQKSTKTAFIVFFAMLTIIFAIVVWPFYKAAFLAFTFAIIFAPLYKFMLTKLRLHQYLASAVTTFIIGICVIIPLAVLLGVVAAKIGNFLYEIGQQLEKGSFSTTMTPMFDAVRGWIESITGSAPTNEELVAAILNVLKSAGRKFYEFSPRVLSTTVSILVNFILMFIFLVVFLAEGRSLYNWFMETSPLSSTHWKELAHEVRITVTTSIVALFVTAFVQGSLLGLAFWIAGFEHPYSWWLIAMILSLIPVIGAPSCYVTSSIVLFFGGNVYGALAFLLFGLLVISTVDNLIKSLIVRGVSRIHPLLVFMALVGAVRIMGPIGLFVGPVLLAIFLASLRIYRREFTQQAPAI